MNDFTKEELENILESVEWWFKDLDADWPEKLYLKIQSMIDNYCYHKKDVISLYTPTGDIPIAYFCYECNIPVNKSVINE